MNKTNPIKIPGFQFAATHCGLKDKKSKKDLAVIYATEPTTTIAGVFTKNKVCAAPVKQCQKNIKHGTGRLIVINSGLANAATGKQGLMDAKSMAKIAAKNFDVLESEVFICSTGKIGEPLPMAKIIKGLSRLPENLSSERFLDCAKAIRTTDAYTKVAWIEDQINGSRFKMAVMAKGAGMICPNMATMLCYVVTDLKISRPVLKALLKETVNETLNELSVDGDTSTNDTVLMMASGLAKNKPIMKDSKSYHKVKTSLLHLLEAIALLIALDGEGATKCFRVLIKGARSQADAKKAARAIAHSQLVKTAIFGCDPNWGRILCAAGYSGCAIHEPKTTILIGNTPVYAHGKPLNKNEKKAAHYLKNNNIVDIGLDLGLGKYQARVLASDLTYGYIKINAEYRT